MLKKQKLLIAIFFVLIVSIAGAKNSRIISRAETNEIVLDNGCEGYSESGTFGSSTNIAAFPNMVGKDHRYCNAVNAYAQWNLQTIPAGTYDLYYNVLVNANNTDNSTLTVYDGIETKTTTIKFKTGKAEYQYIGTFTLDTPEDAYVKIKNNEQGYNIRVDAIKFVPKEEKLPQVPVASNVKIEGMSSIGGKLKGTYEYYDDNSDKEKESVFEWLISDDGQTNWTVLESGTTTAVDGAKLTITREMVGNYIKFTIQPKNDASECSVGEKVESDAVGPIEVVYVIDDSDRLSYYESSDRFATSSTGNVSFNSSHRYVQYPGDYGQWNLKDEEVGVYEVMYYLPLQHNNNEKKLTFEISSILGKEEKVIDITNNQTGDWISLGEYPMASTNECYVKLINKTGASTRYDAMMFKKVAAYEIAPTIENLVIHGYYVVGQELSVSYDYFDLNGDAEEGTTFQWLRAESEDQDEWVVVKEGVVTTPEDMNYSIQKKDVNKYLKLQVTPRSNKEPTTGEAVTSSSKIVLNKFYNPEAKNVTIEGEPWVYYRLKAQYDYEDKNDDLEGGSVYKWFVASYDEKHMGKETSIHSAVFGVNNNKNKNELKLNDKNNSKKFKWELLETGVVEQGKDITLLVNEDMLGKYILFSISPKSEVEWENGKEYFSQVIGPVIEKDVTPVVENITLEGQVVKAEGKEGAAVDGQIEVSYQYSNLLEVEEVKEDALFQWYVAESEDGEYTPIEGATNSKYTVIEEYSKKYIKVGVKVKAKTGAYSEEGFSDPMVVSWKLSFVDEFDYTAKDGYDETFLEKWNSDAGYRELNGIKSARIPENVEVRDGCLFIHNRKETNPNYSFDHQWTTGNIMTKADDFKYGYYECSYKLAAATGLNQSFWLMSDGVMKNDRFIEVDFNEGHYPYEMATNLHYKNPTTQARMTNSIKYYPVGRTETTLATQFNKVSGILAPNDTNYAWDADENKNTYQVFYDDKLLRSTQSLPYDPAGSRIYLSVAIYPGFAGPLVEEEADGSYMQVDYVRYYTPIN